MHFTPIIITAPPQTSRRQVPEVGAPAPCDRVSTEALQGSLSPEGEEEKEETLGGSACGWHRSLNYSVRVVTEWRLLSREIRDARCCGGAIATAGSHTQERRRLVVEVTVEIVAV